MLNSNLATVFTLLILALMAVFGYYQGFIALATRRISSGKSRTISGTGAIALGLLYIFAAIAASAVAVFFYFSL